MWRNERASYSTRWLSALATASLLSLPPSVIAGDSWFSKARKSDKAEVRLLNSVSGVQLLDAANGNGDNSSSATEFEVVVSLDGHPSEGERSGYNNIIRHWANAVCEQSNGAQRISVVRIYSDNKLNQNADVVWKATLDTTPFADGNGLGIGNRRINFASASGSLNYLETHQMLGGYTLAHEWGHYVYGLLDEHPGGIDTDPDDFPHPGDSVNSISLMNRQDKALSDGLDWLNHSIPGANWDANPNTAQRRIYKKSGWEVLTQSTTSDGLDYLAIGQPRRVHYSALNGVKPQNANGTWTTKHELGTTCVDALSNSGTPSIVWMTNQLDVVLLIDRSGSMYGTPLNLAKDAAKTLVGNMASANNVKLAVMAFDDSAVMKVWPPYTAGSPWGVQDLASANVDDVNAAIGGVSVGSATAMYDALNEARQVVSPDSGGQPAANVGKAVFLLSDGNDNSSHSATLDSVATDYDNKNIPLITLGYGSLAPTGVLQELAVRTKGKFFNVGNNVGNSPAKLHSAFAEGLAAVSGLTVPRSAVLRIPGESEARGSFVLDRGLQRARIIVGYSGSVGDMVLSVLAPQGTVVGGVVFKCAQNDVMVSCEADLDETIVAAGGAGAWSLRGVNSTGNTSEVFFSVLGIPGSGGSYNLGITLLGGAPVAYPNPAIVTAAVSNGYRVSGIAMEASVTAPSGQAVPLALNDSGQNGDAVADDGIYTALVDYKESGVYRVEVQANNDAGSGHFTSVGMFDSPQTVESSAASAIGENFSRTASLQFLVTGLEAGGEDHKNDPAKPEECSAVRPDNSQVSGRIDVPGDVDCFRIAGIDTKKGLVVRVARLGLGMAPVLKIYRGDGKTLVATGTAANAASEGGYVFLNLPKAALDPSGVMVATVANADGSAGGGIYSVSAGPSVVSDVRPDTDGDGLRDDKDKCTTSDLRPTLVINGFDTGVKNALLRDGCTLADRVASCESVFEHHGNFPRCVAKLAMDWLMQGHLSGRDVSAIHRSLGAGGHGQ